MNTRLSKFRDNVEKISQLLTFYKFISNLEKKVKNCYSIFTAVKKNRN
jgi:hypothetical protein